MLKCKLHRHPAVLGDTVPELFLKTFNHSKIPKRSVAITLSHLRIWETIIEKNQKHTLIIEDDGLPVYLFDLKDIKRKLPKGYDVCFVNDNLSPNWRRQTAQRFLPLQGAFEQVSEYLTAPGSYGYILSKKGARNLLKLYRQTGIVINTDWTMLSLGIEDIQPRQGLNKIAERVCSKVQRDLSTSVSSYPYLNAYYSAIPLIRHAQMDFIPRFHFEA